MDHNAGSSDQNGSHHGPSLSSSSHNQNNHSSSSQGNKSSHSSKKNSVGTKKRKKRSDLAMQAVNEQMRRALEEDQYSAQGSIVDTDSDSEPETYRSQPIRRLDRAGLQQAVRPWLLGQVGRSWMEEHNKLQADYPRHSNGHSSDRKREHPDEEYEEDDDDDGFPRPAVCKKVPAEPGTNHVVTNFNANASNSNELSEDAVRDGGSIFGQTTGSSNSTWVECDKCGKWRRLRGVVDEKKLPPKWYCSMNKNDPERARCSAPEEEYETQYTPESAADARTRKHFRVWVRRLQTNEAYQARQPLATRNKKRLSAAANTSYEWIRCCNATCGKWRALLKGMPPIPKETAKEWFCVMNTWDEKMASCAAPQENLPALGCPPWVLQDDDDEAPGSSQKEATN